MHLKEPWEHLKRLDKQQVIRTYVKNNLYFMLQCQMTVKLFDIPGVLQGQGNAVANLPQQIYPHQTDESDCARTSSHCSLSSSSGRVLSHTAGVLGQFSQFLQETCHCSSRGTADDHSLVDQERLAFDQNFPPETFGPFLEALGFSF